MTISQEQRDKYINEYIEHLPPQLRPTEVTRAIDLALANGFHNKWDARVLALAVAGGIGKADNPAAVAVHRLQKLSKQRPPKQDATPQFIAEPKAPPLPKDLRDELFKVMRDVMNRVITGEQGTDLIADIYDRFAKLDSN